MRPLVAPQLEQALAWLDRVLEIELALFRAHHDVPRGQGLFISHEEVEHLLSGLAGGAPPGTRSDLRSEWERIIGEPADRSEGDANRPLLRLARRFGLTAFERLLVMVCLAPEIDSRYAKVYAYLNDDVNRKLPSVRLAGRVASYAMDLSADEALLLGHSLSVIRWAMIRVVPDEHGAGPRESHGLALDEHVVAVLFGREELDPAIDGVADLTVEVEAPETGLPDAEAVRAVTGLLESSRTVAPRSPQVFAYFHGPGAGDAVVLARSVASRRGAPLLVVDAEDLKRRAASSITEFADALRRVYREAVMRSAVVHIARLDRLHEEGGAFPTARTLMSLAAASGCLTLAHGAMPWTAPETDAVLFVAIPLDIPDYTHRVAAWARGGVDAADLSPEEVAHLATRYRWTLRDIDLARRHVADRAPLRPDDVAPGLADFVAACRQIGGRTLGPMMRVLSPRASWEDLVLPDPMLRKLRDVCAQARNRWRVYDEWGFEQRRSMGKGLYVLFSGPSGTGKTLTAEVVAHDLGLDLLRVDLSAVVSKYIGETEKNLNRVFDAAERADALLFFDEADGLFGKRSEVRDAHDRYANIEVNYLIQRLDAYDGFVILASNYSQNIDEAFRRRMHVALEFPFPDETSRIALWRTHLPDTAPLADDIDAEALGRRFKIAGGNIRNATINAAFLVAQSDGRIGMPQLLEGVRREYEKMGKLYSESDFRMAEPPVAARVR